MSVSDSIGRFIVHAPADKRSITIHQLLTHTSGLGGTYTGGGITDRMQAIHAILAQPLLFQPGHGYKYGDDDYELLAAIIEIVAGKSWEEYLQSRLLTPLHLTRTGFSCRRAPSSPVLCDWGHKGANGMFSSADDLLIWTRKLITARKFRLITRPQVFVRKEQTLDVSYGYGVRVYSLNGIVTEVMHSGSGDDGHTSIARNLSSGKTVIILSDAGQHHGTTWASFIAHKVF